MIYFDQKYPALRSTPIHKICREACGNFKYKKDSDNEYCTCDDGKVYNKNSVLLYDRNNLPEVNGSLLSSNLDILMEDFYNHESFILFIESKKCDICIGQLDSVLYAVDNYDFKIHYVNYDILSKEDKETLSSIVPFNLKENLKFSNIVLYKKGYSVFSTNESYNIYNGKEIYDLLKYYDILYE